MFQSSWVHKNWQANPNARTFNGKHNGPTSLSVHNGHGHPTSVMHTSAAGSSLINESDSRRQNPVLRTQRSSVNQEAADFSNSCLAKDKGIPAKEPGAVRNTVTWSSLCPF